MNPLISDPSAVFTYLACVLGGLFWLSGDSRLERFFKITPPVIYAYFIPAVSTSVGITPSASPAYEWMVRYLLPASLLLLMTTVDVREVLKLGGKATVMILAGSLGIIVGGPLALALFGRFLPSDTWMGLAALSGSWIGGSANMVAIKESIGTPDSLMGPIIVVDTVVGYGWMGVLLLLSTWQAKFNAWVGADTSVLSALDEKLSALASDRIPTELGDLAKILALGFGGAGLCLAVGDRLPSLGDPTIISSTTWTVVLATSVGLALSFTPARKIERVGGSRVGYLALYLMLTAIGAQANLAKVLEVPLYLAVGLLWVATHVLVLVAAAKFVRAPMFLFATGSMANIGGPVSASVVASVYHPALAPVGVLMGVAGYVIGIYGGLLCAWLLAQVATVAGF